MPASRLIPLLPIHSNLFSLQLLIFIQNPLLILAMIQNQKILPHPNKQYRDHLFSQQKPLVLCLAYFRYLIFLCHNKIDLKYSKFL